MASMKTTKALKNFRIKNFTRLCLCLYGLKMTSMKMTKALKNFRMAAVKTTLIKGGGGNPLSVTFFR